MLSSSFPHQQRITNTLQKSLEAGKISHANLFIGADENEMETMAAAFAQILYCQNPPSRSPQSGLPTDFCGECHNCQLIAQKKHPSVQWIYPESKIRVITTDQIRKLIQSSQLKSLSSNYDINILCSADRLNIQAANAFLKTLEEPVPGKIFILLTRDPEKIIPTILSRCRRFIFEGINRPVIDSSTANWLSSFAQIAVASQGRLLSRYTLLDSLLGQLAIQQNIIETELKAQSPLSKYTEAEESSRERWEKELQASVSSEYRRCRANLLSALELWLRDIWLTKINNSFSELSYFPDLQNHTEAIAAHLSEEQALQNLKIVNKTFKILDTNVQESLALEVFLLKLSF